MFRVSLHARPERVPSGARHPAAELAGASGALERGRSSLVDRTLLRYGVRPLFVGLDVVTFAVAIALTGGLTGARLSLCLIIVIAYAGGGLYRPRLSLSVLDDLPMLVGRAFGAAAVATTIGAVLGTARPEALLTTAAVVAVVAPVPRAVGYSVVRRIRARRVIAHPTLIIGAGQVGGFIGRLLLEHPEFGLQPVGFLDSDPLLLPDERPVPVLGGTNTLASVIVEFGVQDVIVAFGSAPESDMVAVIRTCDRLNCEIFFVPRLFELSPMSRELDQVWGVPIVRLRRAPFRSLQWRLKRVLDVVVSIVALVLLSPILVACAVACRLEGGPGVLFSQRRVGLDGKAFDLLKLRTLKPADESESQTRWSVANDDRVGPVGRLLRRTGLDELPQLWNILRGDMSLVGPRPERPHFVAAFTEAFPRYTARHRVPVGLTGWAQIHGLRGDTSIEDRVRFDNFYVENWSLWADIKIILRTATQVLRGRGS